MLNKIAAIEYVTHLIKAIPLELFVMIGTFIEEVVSPIPAFVIMMPTGAAAHAQGVPMIYLGVLALLSGIARVAGGLLLYWLADKFEDALFAKDRRIFGVSHKQVEQFGDYLVKKRGRTKVWWALFAMHALPVFPGALLSLASGFVRINISTFITTTFFGSLINALFYLYIGYAGLQTAMLLERLDLATQLVLLTVIAGLVAAVLYWYFKGRHKKTG